MEKEITQQTPLDYYSNKLGELTAKLLTGKITGKQYVMLEIKLLEQAKEMQKELIAKAFDDGDYNYYYSKKTKVEFENGLEYYEEVYGGNK